MSAPHIDQTLYSIVETDDRVSACDRSGIEIVGAYQPAGQNCWSLYVTVLVTECVHLRTPPHREHFWGEHGRVDSRAWVQLIAALYVAAAQHERVA